MLKGFEKFTRKGARGVQYPALTCYRSGNLFAFNVNAYREYSFENYKGVFLHYDSSTNRIGIELTNDSDANGFLKLSMKNYMTFISSRGFTNYFKIKPFKTIALEKATESFLIAQLPE